MKFGIPIGNFGTLGKYGDAEDVIAVAERAELLGFDSVWVHDHVFMPALIESRYPYNESGIAGFAYHQDIYDPITMMAAVAVRTSRVRIGTSVLIVPYRDPLVQAQMIATLDQLSHGRILLGIGVGWMEEEFEALGIAISSPCAAGSRTSGSGSPASSGRRRARPATRAASAPSATWAGS